VVAGLAAALLGVALSRLDAEPRPPAKKKGKAKRPEEKPKRPTPPMPGGPRHPPAKIDESAE